MWDYVAPIVCGIQHIPVTFTSPAANDVICFPTSSTLANCKQGVPIRTVSGNTDAILSTDRVSDVRYTASSGATAVTLTQAGTGAFTNNFTMVVTNAQGTGAVTITPATSTINGAATLVIPAGSYCFIYSDNSNYFANCGQSAGGSAGTVTSVGQTVPSWLTVSGSPVTTNGTLAITPATGQTSHQVIGTCGSATSFAPCSLVAGDFPAQYSKGSCTELWGGSGAAFALTSGDDAITNNGCYNDSGVTRTITAVKCRSDNGSNTTTVNPTFGSAGTGTTILSGALTWVHRWPTA